MESRFVRKRHKHCRNHVFDSTASSLEKNATDFIRSAGNRIASTQRRLDAVSCERKMKIGRKRNWKCLYANLIWFKILSSGAFEAEAEMHFHRSNSQTNQIKLLSCLRVVSRMNFRAQNTRFALAASGSRIWRRLAFIRSPSHNARPGFVNLSPEVVTF